MALPLAEDNFISTITAPATSSATSISVAKVPNRAIGYATIYNFDGTQREKIKWGGKSGTIGSAGTLTSLLRGLKFTDSDDVEVSGNKLSITVGMKIVMSVSIHYVNNLIQVINGTDEFPAGATFNDDVSFGVTGKTIDFDADGIITGLATPTAGQTTRAANVAYANALAIAGAPDGAVTVKGIYELATIAEAAAQTAAGGGDTSAALAITTALTSNTSSAEQMIPVTDADGDIPVEFMELNAIWAFTGNNTHSGDETFTGTNVDMTGVTNVTVPTPTSGSHAVTKDYADQKATNVYTAENIVDEGDLLYISSADKVKRYSPESGDSIATATALNASLGSKSVSKVLKITDTLSLFVSGGGIAVTGTIYLQAGTLNAAEDDFSLGTQQTPSGDAAFCFDVVKLTDTLGILLYRADAATDELRARVYTLSGTTISFGTEKVVETPSNNQDSDVRIVRIADDQALIAYELGGGSSQTTLMVLDISGTTITLNTAYTTSEATMDDEVLGLVMWDATSGMVIANRSDGSFGTTAQLFTLSGTVVTFGNILVIAGYANGNDEGDLIKITSTTAVFKRQSSSSATKLALLTTDGSNVTKGADLTVSSSLVKQIGTMAKVSDTIFVSIRNRNGSTNQFMRFFEISGTTIAGIGTELSLGSADASTTEDTSIVELVPGKYVCWNQDLARTPLIVTCTDFYKERIGVANADTAKDADVTVTLVGREASEWTGLTAATQYRLHNDGRPSLLETGVNNQLGVSINTTNIMLR